MVTRSWRTQRERPFLQVPPFEVVFEQSVLFILVRLVVSVFVDNASADPDNLEHTTNRTSKDDDGEDDGHEDRGAQRDGVFAFHPFGESDSDGASKSRPEQHHLVRVRDLFRTPGGVPNASSEPPTVASARDKVDEGADGKDGRITRNAHCELRGHECEVRTVVSL